VWLSCRYDLITFNFGLDDMEYVGIVIMTTTCPTHESTTIHERRVMIMVYMCSAVLGVGFFLGFFLGAGSCARHHTQAAMGPSVRPP